MPFTGTAWLSGISPFAIPVEVESTITETPGLPARVEDVSEDPNLVALRFYVPEGLQGTQGVQGVPGLDAADPILTAEVTSHSPNTTPSVTVTGVYPNKLLSFALRDGEQGPIGPDGPAGPAGAPGLSSSVFSYQFQTTTTAPPGSGHVLLNFNPPSGATGIFVSHLDINGIDQSILLANIQPNSVVTIQKNNDDTIYARFTSFGLTTFVGYSELLVNYDARAGTLTNNMQIILVVQIAGPQGPQGPQGDPGINAVNPAFTASVTSSGPSVTPAVALTGVYPNLNIGFALRDGTNGTNGTNGINASDPAFTASVTSSGPSVTPAVALTGVYPNLNIGFALRDGADGATGPQGPAGSGSNITITNTASAVAFRLLFTNVASGSLASSLLTHASALTYNASTLALTNTGGTFSCSTVTANLTGTASTSSTITTANSVAAGFKYLMFTNTVGASASALVTSTLASQLAWDPSVATFSVGNLTTGVGIVTCNTVNATNLNGNASTATQANMTSTAAAAERFLCFVPGSGNQGIQVSNVLATKIACNPSTPSITLGSGVGGSGVVTSNSFVGALTGNASSATQVTATSTATTGTRYLLFTPSTGTGVSDVQFSPTLATQIYVQPSTPALFIGNGITGSGTLTVATVTCTTMNGQATGSDMVETIATTTAATRYITFTPSSNSSLTNSMIQTAVGLTYNPGSALLSTANLTVSGTLTATVSTSTNLAGGAGGSIPYQSAAGTTTFLPISTVAGQVLRTTGTVPSWATSGGFPISFGGNASAAGMVLQYGLPSALFAATTLNSTLNTPANCFVTPYACILVAAAGYSTTSSATATVTIHVNGAAALTTIPAGQFTATGARTFTLSATTNTIAAGSLVEVRVNTAAIGACSINLYVV